jgi:hypothetical protein
VLRQSLLLPRQLELARGVPEKDVLAREPLEKGSDRRQPLFLDIPQANIAFWEWSNNPPRSDLLPKMAKALAVSVEDLLVTTRSDAALATRPGPVGEVQRAFEEVRSLPRKQQRKVVEFVFAFVHEYKRKAG